MIRRVLFALAVVLTFSSIASATPFTLVVPNANANTVGVPNGGVNGNTRFQEVLGSGQFFGPILITDFYVRAYAGAGPVDFSYPSFSITMSTTQAYPNTNGGHLLPSTTFADNVGPDATVVFNTPFTVHVPGCAGPAPCAFDIGAHLSTPFFYDPSLGRLLLDFRISPAFGTFDGQVDLAQFAGFTGSVATLQANGPNPTTGTLESSGIIVELQGQTVPEPATLTLLGTGLAAAATRRLRARHR
jgi:hypothetical protein